MNVAEHHYFVVLLTSVFCRQLSALDVLLDTERTLLYALWHDAEEALTGDIPHDVKRFDRYYDVYVSPIVKQGLDHLESAARIKLASEVGMLMPAATPLEVTVVKIADWTELILYETSERRRGNTEIQIAAQRIWKLMLGDVRDNLNGIPPTWYDALLEDLAAHTEEA